MGDHRYAHTTVLYAHTTVLCKQSKGTYAFNVQEDDTNILSPLTLKSDNRFSENMFSKIYIFLENYLKIGLNHFVWNICGTFFHIHVKEVDTKILSPLASKSDNRFSGNICWKIEIFGKLYKNRTWRFSHGIFVRIV